MESGATSSEHDPANMEKPLRVLISYSHKDTKLKDEFLEHLEVARQFKDIALWTDDLIEPGADWRKELESAFQQADVVLLLVSRSLLASNLIRDGEVPKMIARQQERGLLVIPVIMRDCVWKEHPMIQHLHPLPPNGEPIFKYTGNRRDRTFNEIVTEIIKLARKRTPKAPKRPAQEQRGIPAHPQELPSLRYVANGTELAGIISNADAVRPTHAECTTDEETEMVGEFLQHCHDLMEIWEEISIRQRVDETRSLTQMIDHLNVNGWAVFASLRPERLVPHASINVATIRVIPLTSNEIVMPKDGLEQILASLSEKPAHFIYHANSDEKLARRIAMALIKNGVVAFSEWDSSVEELVKTMRDKDRIILACSKSLLEQSNVANVIETILMRQQFGPKRLMSIQLDDYVVHGWSPSRYDTVDAVRKGIVANFEGADTDDRKFDEALRKLIAVLQPK